MSFGEIPALSMAATDACVVISAILSLNFPYLVLPAPRTQTFSTNVTDPFPYKNCFSKFIIENGKKEIKSQNCTDQKAYN